MRGRAIGLVVLAACSGDIGGEQTPPRDGALFGGDGSAPPADVMIPGGEGEPTALAGMTLFHNQVRAGVQTDEPLPFLTWNADLAATAAAWAAQCIDQEAPTGLIDHNPGRSTGHPYYVGENIYGAGGGATAQGAVELWASEEADYNYANNACSGVCGHYTQIVWRATREVGCALHDCPGLTYGNSIVCNYGPGGNSGGDRPY